MWLRAGASSGSGSARLSIQLARDDGLVPRPDVGEEVLGREQLPFGGLLAATHAEAILELKLRHLAKLEEVKIRAEQDELSSERAQLQKLLGSEARLKTLIKNELTEVAEQFGDERRSRLVERSEARAFTELDLMTTDPVTVVMSEKGWIRAAKGHDIDPGTLSLGRLGPRRAVPHV